MNFYYLRPGLSTLKFPEVILQLRATVIMMFVVCSKIIWAWIGTGGLTNKASALGNIDHIQERTINWK